MSNEINKARLKSGESVSLFALYEIGITDRKMTNQFNMTEECKRRLLFDLLDLVEVGNEYTIALHPIDPEQKEVFGFRMGISLSSDH